MSHALLSVPPPPPSPSSTSRATELTLPTSVTTRLRLFLSPFFSVHVALQYLKLYPENIGITHYLTSRLRGMPTREVEFYWPELWCVRPSLILASGLIFLELCGTRC